jgi:ribosomal protein S18 acetylase RimI-like enzyme
VKDIIVRQAVLEDLPILLEFEQGIVMAERPFDPTLKKEYFNYYDLKSLIESNEAEVVVAVDGDLLVGSGYGQIRNSKIYLTHDKHVYLGFMYVEPTYRGKGVNKIIIDNLKNWAKSRAIKEVRLHVYDENTDAIKAYEKAGFQKYLIEMRTELK